MSSWNAEQLIADDKRYVWHPFATMGDWCAPEHEPIVLVEGKGAIVRDSRGREYIDLNSSIWTNIPGDNHPRITAALREQLDRLAHTSLLGTTIRRRSTWRAKPCNFFLRRSLAWLFTPVTVLPELKLRLGSLVKLAIKRLETRDIYCVPRGISWRHRGSGCDVREGGLLTRPIRDTIVFMLPLCIKTAQIEIGLSILKETVAAVLMTKRVEKIGAAERA